MIKQNSCKKLNLLFCITIILTVFFNSSFAQQLKKNTLTIAPLKRVQAIPFKAKAEGAFLDTLWLDVSNFLALEKKIAFRFYFGQENDITLHGWSSDGNVFNDTPDVKLKKGRKSSVAFGAGNYLGNLTLKRSEIHEIKRLIKTSSLKYVLFAPQDPLKNNGQITYDIYLTIDDPGVSAVTLIPSTAVRSGVKTNPSPPRNL